MRATAGAQREAPAIEDDPAPGPAPAGLARTLRLARPVWARLSLGSSLGAGAVLADIGLVATAAWLVSTASERPNESHLALAIVGVQFFGLSRGFLRYAERLRDHDTALRLLSALRVRVFERLERLAPAGLLAFRRGDLLTRMVADVDALQDVVVRVIPPFVVALVVGAATAGFLGWLLPAAGLILAAALLLGGTVVPWLTGVLARRREARQAGARADLNAALLDLDDGLADLLAFGAVDAQLDIVERLDGELTDIASASATTAGMGAALTTLLVGLAGWGCLVVGIPAVTSGRMARTDLAVLALVPLATFELVAALPAATQAFARVRQSAARVFGILDAPEPVAEPSRPIPVPEGPREVLAHGVGARHPGAARSALRGVDLDLSPGRRVALVGPSGAGKTTLSEVLLRFLEVDGGSVRLDEVPLDRLSGDELRHVVGLVGQDVHLFDTTIAANLRIGRSSATDVELWAVLGRVGLGGWVESLPAGLASDVGRNGTRVSGGQGRRLALARALLADFPVLVVDEPAEHLDPVTADGVLADLLGLTGGRSLLLITHRLTGLETVDEIVVLDGGRVVERGTHAELVDLGGDYADAWWDQTGGRANADPVVLARAFERPAAPALSGVHNPGSPPP